MVQICDMTARRKPITVRLPPDLIERLREATDREKNPLAPQQTQLIELGIRLALDEIEKGERWSKKNSRRSRARVKEDDG